MSTTKPATRTIVIAPTIREGRSRFPDAVAVITPRAPHGHRGRAADRVVIISSMVSHPAAPTLLASATPCLATVSGGRVEVTS